MLCYATNTNSTELDVTALMLIKTAFSDLPLFRGVSNTAITSTGEKTYTDLNQYCWGDFESILDETTLLVQESCGRKNRLPHVNLQE